MSVEFLGQLTGDNAVVDAARVSFSKRASMFKDADNEKLIKYLFDHKHWAPFAAPRECFALDLSGQSLLQFLLDANLTGFSWALTPTHFLLNGSLWAWAENLQFLPAPIATSVRTSLALRYPMCANVFWPGFAIDGALAGGNFRPNEESLIAAPQLEYCSFRIAAPIFVARQLVKHQKELVWSEESRRYIDTVPQLYWPEVWHGRPINKKQGASDDQINFDPSIVEGPAINMVQLYTALLGAGIAPEECRMILPLNCITNWIWTGSLAAWRRVCQLRLDPHSQGATRQVAEQIFEQLAREYPGIWPRIYAGEGNAIA